MLFNHTIVKTQNTPSLALSISSVSRLAFNSKERTTSTCKWNTNKLKNVTNKMCIKTEINMRLKKLIAVQLYYVHILTGLKA